MTVTRPSVSSSRFFLQVNAGPPPKIFTCIHLHLIHVAWQWLLLTNCTDDNILQCFVQETIHAQETIHVKKNSINAHAHHTMNIIVTTQR